MKKKYLQPVAKAAHAVTRRSYNAVSKKAKWPYAFGLVVIVAAALFVANGWPAPVQAAACATPPTDYGTDTLTVNVPSTTTYVLWTRLMAPDSTNNTVNVQIDSNNCYTVGGGAAIPANTWTWVNYQNGATATPITMSLTAGSHTVKLIGVAAGVSVDRVILTSDTSCTPTGNGDSCATGDSTPPTVSLIAPANNSTATGTVTLTATASDASGIASVQFLVDGQVVNTDTSSPYSFSWNSGAATNGTHTLAAQAVDAAGNTAISTNVTVTVNNTVQCTTAPSVPTGLAAPNKTSSTVSLSWNASTASTGCTLSGYKLFRNGSLITTVTSGTTFTDSGLTPSTAYSYAVAAVDTSGHTSANTGAVSATTLGDTTPPSTPANVHTTLITTNNIALAWDASTDNIGVTGYQIFRGGTQIGTSATNAFTDSGLTANTTYSYTVKAIDASSNVSAASTALNAKTLTGSSANTGDLNNDGHINIVDLSILLSHWNQTGVSITQGDCNGDGKVTITDLSILLSHWG